MSGLVLPHLKARAYVRLVLRDLTPAEGHRLWLALACVLAATLSAAIGPLALKALIDALPSADAAQASALPALLLGAYVASLLMARLAGEARAWLFGRTEQGILRRLGRDVLAHMLRLPLGFHAGRPTGASVQVLENGRQGIRLLLQHALFTLIPGLLELLFMAVMIAVLFDEVFLLLFGGYALAYMAVFADGARRVMAASRQVSSRQVTANARLADTLLNVETVKLFSGEATILSRYDSALAGVELGWRDFYRARALNGVLVALLFTAALGLTLSAGLLALRAETMTLGGFVLVHTYMLQLARPVELLGYGVRDIGQGAAFLDLLGKMLDLAPEPDAACLPDEAITRSGPARITFEDVHFAYEDGRPVLEGLSFELEPGSMTALVGASGAGKSSIGRLLLGFYTPQSGRILIDHVPITDYPRARLREMIALIPQEVGLFDASLAFNIGFPNEGASQEEIRRAAGIAQLGDLVSLLPEGFDTQIGERGLRLSGGERQRVAIARAALRQPKLLIADEATASLDQAAEAAIARDLKAAAGGATLLVIAHRLATVVSADKILVIENGRITEAGTHSALIQKGGTYAAMWHARRT